MSAKPPRFLGKQTFFTLCYNQSGFEIRDDFIQFSHKHPTYHPLIFKIPSNLIIASKIVKQIEIMYQNRTQKWFICINYEISPPQYHDNGLYQAIDLGVNNLVSAVN